MTDEKKYASDYGFPESTVAIYITNKKGEIFLIRSPKWANKLVPCGGHIEFKEKIVDAVVREAKEETGFDVHNIELLTAIDMIDPIDFSKSNRHFAGLQYKVEIIDEKQVHNLDNIEALDGYWFKPEEIVKRDDVEKNTKNVIENFFVKQKKSLFNTKKCKDCEKVKKECEEYKTGWQRAMADYKNLQREISNMKGEWARLSEQQILEEFIPVYDNLKKAFANEQRTCLPDRQAKSKEQDNWNLGIKCIMQQFGNILKAHNVIEIKTIGEKFDHNFHEAIGEEELKEFESGIVIREVEGGYQMSGKVIRVAKVIVAK